MYDGGLVFGLWEMLEDIFCSRLKALVIKLFCFVDQWVYYEDLTAESDLVTHEFI